MTPLRRVEARRKMHWQEWLALRDSTHVFLSMRDVLDLHVMHGNWRH